MGFIGLGNMGERIAVNILKNGFPLVVWNRTSSKAMKLAELGAKVARSPKELAESADVVFSMLSEPEITKDVLTGVASMQGVSVIDGLTSGKIVVDMSTNSPTVTRQIAEKVRMKNSDFVEAPVMGGTFIAEQAKLTVLAAGRKESVDAVTPILKATSQKVLHVGDIGMGMTLKLILNLYLWVNMASYAECVVLASKLGIDPKTLTEIFNNTVLKNYVTEHKAEKIVNDEWSPVATVDVVLKDLKLVLDMAEMSQVPTPLGALTKELYTVTAQMGLRDFDAMAIALAYGRMANERISKLLK
ncbi:MAG: NAD(P)-dependent oxidoreductase [Candidatus Caldarchaeum sp.]|nr:NAD(P)-dependent oxidoreductase [Candidatus Caldarchaeum sp.]